MEDGQTASAGTNREKEKGILAYITLALEIMCGYKAAMAATVDDSNSNLSRPNKRMEKEISEENNMGNWLEDRLLCHGGGHGFGSRVDDKLLHDRSRGTHKLFKNI